MKSKCIEFDMAKHGIELLSSPTAPARLRPPIGPLHEKDYLPTFIVQNFHLPDVLELIDGCRSCCSKEELTVIFKRLKQWIPFEVFSATIAEFNIYGRLTGEFNNYLDYPTEFVKEYVDRKLFFIDPVILCNFDKSNFGALQRWSSTYKHEGYQLSYALKEQRNLIELANSFNCLREGYTFGDISKSRDFEGSMICLAGGESLHQSQKKLLEVLKPYMHMALTNLRRINNESRLLESQKKVLNLLQDGLSRKEIAEELHCSEANVKRILNELFETLEVSRQSCAINRAIAKRMIRIR